jgi:hypothetical protein
MNTPARPTSTAAIVSLVFGILSWMLLPFAGAVVAVIAGHMARGEIRRANGAMDGDGLAIGGLVLGWLHLAAMLLFVLAMFLFLGGLAFLGGFAGMHAH